MTAPSRQADILILNQMAGPLTCELAEDMARAGYSVHLLTGHPDTLAKGSQGKLHLHRSVEYQRGGMPQRVWSWACYLAHAFFWLWKFPGKTPLLVFSNPPMLAWLAAGMRALRGTPYCIMVHDIYPDLLIRMNHLRTGGRVATVWQRLNRWAYEHAEEVLTLGAHMARILDQQFNATSTRSNQVLVIRPWADTVRIEPLPKSENPFADKHQLTDRLTIMYSGNMGWGHDIETMLAATTRLTGSAARFLFIGAGPKWSLVQQHLQTSGQHAITLLGWLPEDELPYSLPAADLALVSLEPEVGGLAIPSKAFYSLAAGTPLIVIADKNTELADIVRRHECGWTVSPGDDQRLAEIVSNMLAAPDQLQRFKANARKASEEIGSRSRNSRAFMEVLEGAFWGSRASRELPAGRPQADQQPIPAHSVSGPEASRSSTARRGLSSETASKTRRLTARRR